MNESNQHRYSYLDADGNLCGAVLVGGGVRRFSNSPGLFSSTKDGLPSVYNLETLAESSVEEPVWLVSDERIVEALGFSGILAVSPAYTLDTDKPETLTYILKDPDVLELLNGHRILIVTNSVLGDGDKLDPIRQARAVVKKDFDSKLDRSSIQTINLETKPFWKDGDKLPTEGEVFSVIDYFDAAGGPDEAISRIMAVADRQKARQDRQSGKIPEDTKPAEIADLPEDESWKDGLKLTEDGKVKQTIENARLIFLNDPYLKDAVGGVNLLEHAVYCGPKMPWRHKHDRSQLWEDDDTYEVEEYMESAYSFTNSRRITAALHNVQRHNNAFNPLIDLVDSLEWDGIPRLDTLFIDFLGAEDTEYMRAVSRKVFTGAVARLYNPGSKFDWMAVISGAQGMGKSTFLSKMSLGFFTDRLGRLDSKEAFENIQGKWLIELGELESMKKADVETQKRFITSPSDRFRVPYEKNATDHPRICVFVGTTNEFDYLYDATGNRRYWPVDANPAHIKLSVFKDLTDDYCKQAIAEAKYRYQQGEPLELPPHLEKVAEELQELHRAKDPNEIILERFLNATLPVNYYDMDHRDRIRISSGLDTDGQSTIQAVWDAQMSRKHVCIQEILHDCFQSHPDILNNSGQATAIKIGRWLKKFGWDPQPPKSLDPLYGKQRYYTKQR